MRLKRSFLYSMVESMHRRWSLGTLLSTVLATTIRKGGNRMDRCFVASRQSTVRVGGAT